MRFLLVDRVAVSDSVNGLRAGDPLLLLFAADGSLAAVRQVRSTEGPTPEGRSTIHLDPVPAELALTIGLLVALVAAMQPFLPGADAPTRRVIDGFTCSNLSNTASHLSRGMPAPVSATRTSAAPAR